MSLGNIYDSRELLNKFVERIEIGQREGKYRTRELVLAARIPPLGLVTPGGSPDKPCIQIPARLHQRKGLLLVA